VTCAVPMGNSSVQIQSRNVNHRFAKISYLTYDARKAVRSYVRPNVRVLYSF
jgi:hypothetical protein